MIVKTPLLGYARTCMLLVPLLALSTTPALAGETRSPSKTGPVSVKKAPAKKTTAKPAKLYGTRWHRGAEATVAAAGKAKKPAFLVRMLGELDGKT